MGLFLIGIGAGVGTLSGCSDGPASPPAIQDRLALSTFQSCDDLENYIEDQAVRDMQTQIDCMKSDGWCTRPELLGAAGAQVDNAVPSTASGPGSYTTTNTQVAGVDEADFMKNDGTRIFVLSGQQLRAVKSWPADQLALAGSLSIEGYPGEMYLDDQNRIVVFSSVYTQYAGFAEGGASPGAGVDIACVGIDGCGAYYGNTTKMTVVDVSDITNLRVIGEYYLPGNYADSRRIGSSVRLVLSDYFRWPSAVQFYPTSSDPALYSDKAVWNAALDALKAQNEQIIRAQTLDQWLPPVRRKLADGTIINVPYQCSDFYQSNASVHLGMATVATLDLDSADPTPSRSIIMGEVGQIYASPTSLYIASPHWWWWPVPGQKDWTYLHKFDLTDPTRAIYVASGGAEGHIVDSYSMDENQGYFRLAMNLSRRFPDVQNPQDIWGITQTSSQIAVLGEDAGALVNIGQSDEFAQGETIQSSRFVGNMGFVVTYHQVDPLWTFDLSQPSTPRRVGELTVPGYSTYIYPLDTSHLLTIGVYQPYPNATDDTWMERRLQLSMFDVSDFANPRQTFTQLVGTAYGWSDATYDHHAFNYFPQRNLLAIPFSDYTASTTSDPFSNFVSDIRVFSVDTVAGINPAGSLSMKDVYELGGAPGWYYWYSPWIRRSVMASDNGVDYVYAVSDAGVRSADLANPATPLGTVVFPKVPVQ